MCRRIIRRLVLPRGRMRFALPTLQSPVRQPIQCPQRGVRQASGEHGLQISTFTVESSQTERCDPHHGCSGRFRLRITSSRSHIFAFAQPRCAGREFLLRSIVGICQAARDSAERGERDAVLPQRFTINTPARATAPPTNVNRRGISPNHSHAMPIATTGIT